MKPNKHNDMILRPRSSAIANEPTPCITAPQKPPSLSPSQIPLVEASDTQIPNDFVAAEALGVDENELHEEILAEELQRHPDAHGDEEDMKSLSGVAEELHRRLAGLRPS